jgi:NAD(P)-dependent dehydrogenase (short-subunit alcohol dehydrogenase family)
MADSKIHEGKRVFITAGAGGIGLGIARAFLAEGARVHVVDISQEAVDAAVAANEGLTGSVGDVTKAEDMDRVFEEVRQQLGGLDVMVSNAGVAGPTVSVEDYPQEGWDAAIGVNLNGSFAVAQRAIPLLKESRNGTYLIMSSLAGRFGYKDRIGYATAKWGLVGFMKTLALELGDWGINVNSIHPGAVNGPRIETVLQGRADANGTTLEQERESALANQSIKRFVEADEIGQLAVFLASPAAKSISGQLMPIDGDSKAAS